MVRLCNHGAVWDAQQLTWIYDVSGLEDGKHSLKIDGFDVDGNPAYDLLIPFWTGPSADFEWQDALIDMVMTDSFVFGNTSNDEPMVGAAQGADWQGGDFAGVTQMIESGYFDDLGVGALWLSPFNTAANGTGKAADGVHDVSAFHGYWPTEPRGIEPKLGTAEELHALIEAAHERDIRVMMDFVVNHVHEQHTYYEDNPEWFNAGCICGAQIVTGPSTDSIANSLRTCRMLIGRFGMLLNNSSMTHCGGWKPTISMDYGLMRSNTSKTWRHETWLLK